MKIYAKQIDSASLTDYINEAVSGGFFSGQLSSYLGANGYLGPNVLYVSGGSQIISGSKTFDASPFVPYSGGTGTAPSRKYVDDQNTANIISFSGNYVNLFLVDKNSTQIISGLKTFTGAVGVGTPTLSTHAATKDYVDIVSGAISSGGYSIVKVTGSSALLTANFTGAGGTIVRISGDYVLISGAGASAAASNSDGINLSGRLVATGALLSALSVTGSSIMQTPNLTGMGGTLVIRSGSYVLISGAGGGGGSSVSVTGSNTIALPNFTGVDGVIVRQSGSMVLISGGAGAGTFVESNTYNITGTGTNNIYPSSSGSMSNTYNVSGNLNINPLLINGITGNFVNISFFFDEYNLATGLNLIEGFVSRDFIFTGYAVGAFISGVNGFLSGSLYQRNTNNVKTEIAAFSLLSGSYFNAAGGFNRTVSGMHRVGVDIFRLATGITGVSVGLFGVGY
jgi:hypothetical protein